MTRTADEVHAKSFVPALRKGHEAQRDVAIALLDAGLPVRMSPLEVRETWADVPRYRDEADIDVAGFVIEVKSSTHPWTCREDYPFNRVLLYTVKRYEECTRKPDAYVKVSQPTGARLVLYGWTYPEWVKVPMRDSTRGGWVTETYAAPPRCLTTWEALVDLLRARESF